MTSSEEVLVGGVLTIVQVKKTNKNPIILYLWSNE